jgi:hypothetical protein
MGRRLTDPRTGPAWASMPPRAFLLEPLAPSNREPLADHLARGRITQAQYLAAQEFRKHYRLAAGKMLTESYRALGADGSAVVHDMLINAMSAKEVAAHVGFSGVIVSSSQRPLIASRRQWSCRGWQFWLDPSIRRAVIEHNCVCRPNLPGLSSSPEHCTSRSLITSPIRYAERPPSGGLFVAECATTLTQRRPSLRADCGALVRPLWRQNANHWRSLTRPGWDAQVAITQLGELQGL